MVAGSGCRITLGTAQLGIQGYGIANKVNRLDADSLLAYSVRCGIESYDTATVYGEAERILGRFFADRDKPVFITKMMIETAGKPTKRDIERQMYDSAEASLNLLNVPVISGLLIHNPHVLERWGETITAVLARMQKEGIVERCGISIGAEADDHYRICAPYLEQDLYELVQVPMNLFDHRLLHNGAMQRFRQNGKAVYARSVFLQGLFFLQPHLLPAHLQEAQVPLRRLHELAEQEGMSIAQLAFSYVRDMEGVGHIVVGAETTEQLAENIAYLDGPPLSERALQQVRQSFSSLPRHLITPTLWEQRK